LGLKLLREFIIKNEGRIQIVSDKGYWVVQGDAPRICQSFTLSQDFFHAKNVSNDVPEAIHHINFTGAWGLFRGHNTY
jgi:hypothetical protein